MSDDARSGVPAALVAAVTFQATATGCLVLFVDWSPLIFGGSLLLTLLLTVVVAGYSMVRQPDTIMNVPGCPYCERRSPGTFAAPHLIMERRWAWCGSCGGLYVHATRTWRRPRSDVQLTYRDDGGHEEHAFADVLDALTQDMEGS